MGVWVQLEMQARVSCVLSRLMRGSARSYIATVCIGPHPDIERCLHISCVSIDRYIGYIRT